MTTETRGRPRSIPDSSKELVAHLYTDHTGAEIAQKLGVSVRAVYDALDRFGIPRRSKLDDQIRKNIRAYQESKGITPPPFAESYRPIP